MKPLLSICIPTFNRYKELKRLINSIDKNKDIELVIVDDGSKDETANIFSEFNHKFIIKYIYQINLGRAWALYKAINNANGDYTIIMDSDDYFTPNAISKIIKSIKKNEKNYKAFIFGTYLKKLDITINSIPEEEISNFNLVHHKFKTDMKQIVFTNFLKRCNYKPNKNCRRVPTQLIWARVAEKEDCFCFPFAIAVKEYLPGGMSDNIFKLKMSNPEPMKDLYKLLSISKRYNSIKYRIKYNILFFRYCYHIGNIHADKPWQFFFIPFGFIFFLIDRIRLYSI